MPQWTETQLFYLLYHRKYDQNHPKKLSTLAKLQSFSVIPWRPNRPKNRKNTRFIWVFIVPGIYNFNVTLIFCSDQGKHAMDFHGWRLIRIWFLQNWYVGQEDISKWKISERFGWFFTEKMPLKNRFRHFLMTRLNISKVNSKKYFSGTDFWANIYSPVLYTVSL